MLRTHTIALLLTAVSALATTQAHAFQRTHVSAAIGSDVNAKLGCTAAAPCRFFTTAMAVTDADGEVIVLDSGGYDPVIITKSISLIAPKGVYAGISVPSNSNGINIHTPGVNVVLRGLTIIGQGGNNNGINMTAGINLTVENCEISNLQTNGIAVTGNATVQIIDTIIRRNGQFGIALRDGVIGTITRAIVSGNASAGILANGSIEGITTNVDIADSTLSGNLSGAVAQAGTQRQGITVNMSVHGSRVVQNSNAGLVSDGIEIVSKIMLTASNNIISNNGDGIASLFGGIVVASGNTVTRNRTSGFRVVPGHEISPFVSARNNALYLNGPDGHADIVGGISYPDDTR
jgi:hypothetical protein